MVIHNGKPAGTSLDKVVSALTKGCSAVSAQVARWKEHTSRYMVPACQKAGRKACDICDTTGTAAAQALKVVSDALHHRLSVVGGWVMDRAIRVTDRCGERILVLLKGLARPFRSLYRAPRLIADGYRRGGAKEAFFTLTDGICNNLYIFKTVINYALPVLGIVFLFNVVQSGIQLNYALALEQDGEVVAYVEDESVYTEAYQSLLGRVISTDDSTELSLKPTFTVAAVNPEDISTAEELTDSLIQMSTTDIQQAQGLYIDGQFYGAVTSAGLIEGVLDDTLAQYTTGAEGETVEFVQDIQLREGLFPTASLVDADEIVALLTSEVQSKRTYTIQKGDSPIMIANKNGLTYSEFKAMNPEIEEECMIGQETIISESEPFLNVRATKTITYDESIPYDTETTEDSSKAQGYSVVTQEGQNGTKSVTARVVSLNGTEESREILSETVTAEPVTEKITKGTKVEATYRASYSAPTYGSGTVNGSFIWPTSGGYISCYYGSGGHRGLDIANSYGKPIYASMAGKVVVSGWYYSYGKCVVIDHGNGVRTLYGHCSSLNVSVGQSVSQGQVIALVGSTGYSTGNHLHFEVQINGSTRNPLNYIG